MRWLTAAIVLLVLAASSRTSADPDLWGHVRFGLDTLHQRALSSVDPYSFTQDVPWINHEWLSELQMGVAYAVGGIAGLAMLKGVLTTTALFLVWRALRDVEIPVRMAVLGVVMVGCAWLVTNLRPQLWSLVMLAGLCRILTSDGRTRRWIPVLLLVWANVHGGWIVGLGIVAMWAAVEIAVTRQRVLEWILIVAASVIATLVTPYGIGLWRFLWKTVHLTRDIDEWRPMWQLPAVKWIGWIAAAAAAVWFNLRPWRYRAPAFAVAAILAVASLRVSRLSALFVMTTAVLLAPVIRERYGVSATSTIEPKHLPLAAAALTLIAVWTGVSSLTCIPVSGVWAAPANVVAHLSNAPAGRLVTFFDWGEYAIWHLGPRIRVSMDGRRETVYSDRRLAEHDAIVEGTPDGLATLDSWQPEYVWLPASSRKTREWLGEHQYRFAVNDAESFLAVRRDISVGTEGTSGLTPRCFPL